MRCIPAGAAHQIAKRPSPWWLVSTIRNARLPRTKNVGAPWLRRSLASGSARQILRSRLSVRSRSADETIGMMVARGNALVALLLSGAVAAGPPSPATATRAFGHWLQKRYAGVKGYRTCPAGQVFGGDADCWAEVGSAGDAISSPCRQRSQAVRLASPG